MHSHLTIPRPRWPSVGGRAGIAIALAMIVGIIAARAIDPNVGDGEGRLFVLPVAVLALRFGLRGGVASALLVVALVIVWDLNDPHTSLTPLGYANRGVPLVVLGAVLGAFVDRRRSLEEEITRYYNGSLDLLGTIDLTGRFRRVNPAWERMLGHPAATICSRPFIQLVHPDDREATAAELAELSTGARESISFRNRVTMTDGKYRWLEWNASASLSEGEIHAVARDITVHRKAELQLANNARLLEAKVGERTHDLDDARAETLRLLAVAAEYRDDSTAQHTERVGELAAEIGRGLGLRSEQVRRLREAAPLHDVGKIAIPDHILLKPGRLSAAELEVMRTHADLGARLLSGSNSPVLQMASTIAATHHEWWDGTGYPTGLAGERIPLVGRIVAVADVYDALTHDRPYKAAWPVGQAIAMIRRACGSQFDPRAVDAFLAMHDDARFAANTNTRQEPASRIFAPRAAERAPAA
jgi:PAS domain S-box-containing protein